jgi:TOBE domain
VSTLVGRVATASYLGATLNYRIVLEGNVAMEVTEPNPGGGSGGAVLETGSPVELEIPAGAVYLVNS